MVEKKKSQNAKKLTKNETYSKRVFFFNHKVKRKQNFFEIKKKK